MCPARFCSRFTSRCCQQKTAQQLIAEEEERQRLEREKRRMQVLATTHQAAMSMFGAAMMPVADFYGREALLVRLDMPATMARADRVLILCRGGRSIRTERSQRCQPGAAASPAWRRPGPSGTTP